MNTASAKAKGRRLQQWVRDQVLSLVPSFRQDDVKSTPMGSGGEDVQLSPFARDILPLSFECKSYKKFAVYGILDQANANKPEGTSPVVVLKADRRVPLVVCEAEHYFDLWKKFLDEEGAN